MEEKLEKPHSAYVASVTERLYRIDQLHEDSTDFAHLELLILDHAGQRRVTK